MSKHENDDRNMEWSCIHDNFAIGEKLLEMSDRKLWLQAKWSQHKLYIYVYNKSGVVASALVDIPSCSNNSCIGAVVHKQYLEWAESGRI